MGWAARFAGFFLLGSLLFTVVAPILVAPIPYLAGYPHWLNLGLLMGKVGSGFALGFAGFHCYERACFGPPESRASHPGLDEFGVELGKIRDKSVLFYWFCILLLFVTPLFSFVLLYALVVRPFLVAQRQPQGWDLGVLQKELAASWVYFAQNLWRLTLLLACTLFGVLCSFAGLALYHVFGH